MLDPRLLRSFVAVAETEHISKAAERLHLSQSPLSRQIRQLEEELGLTLFQRIRQRVRLTDEGRWLLAEARDLLSRMERVERDAGRVAQGELGRLAIGFVRSAMWSRVLPRALRRYRRDQPDVRISLRSLGSSDQLAALQAGELDVALVHEVPGAPGMTAVPIYVEPYLLALPPDHRLRKKSRLHPGDLDGEPWVMLVSPARPDAQANFLAACRRAGFAPNVQFEVADRGTVVGLVEAGMGLALLPESARRIASPDVVFRTVPWFPVKLTLWLVHRAGDAPAILRFVELLPRA